MKDLCNYCVKSNATRTIKYKVWADKTNIKTATSPIAEKEVLVHSGCIEAATKICRMIERVSGIKQ